MEKKRKERKKKKDISYRIVSYSTPYRIASYRIGSGLRINYHYRAHLSFYLACPVRLVPKSVCLSLSRMITGNLSFFLF